MKKQNENETEETFLSEWIDGRISDEQLKERVGETDFMAYRQLKQVLKGLDVVNPELTEHYARVQEKIEQRRSATKSVTPKLYRYLAMAAMLLLFAGLYQIFVFSESYHTGKGGMQRLTLNDQSVVTLNAGSNMKCPGWFQFNRKLTLQGEAFFEVKKGSRFTVTTDQGSVEVLGTQFNVIARPGFFEVTCFEGKVKISTKQETATITKGMAVRYYSNKKESWEHTTEGKPTWISGETTYRQLPLKLVIGMMMEQYNCTITFPESVAQTKITGGFTNKDRDVALQSICIPLQLKYKQVTPHLIRIYE